MRRAPILVAAALTLTQAPPAAAYFDNFEIGSRAVSLGRSFVAAADDASAIYWNPAGLSGLERREVLFDYARPYVVDGLRANAVALAWPLRFGTVAAGWNHQGITGVTSEDMFSLSAATATPLPGVASWRLLYGATLKAARVGYSATEEDDYGSQTRITGDVGVLLSGPRGLRFGGTVRNVREPEFDFVPGGGGTVVGRRFDAGLVYQWNPDSRILASIGDTDGGSAEMRLGGEIAFYRVLAVRAGVSGSQFAGGIGLQGRTWRLESAFVSHLQLGVSYRVTLTVPFGAEVPR